MLYSIIIPTFNAENTIKQCIGSIIQQTYHDYEIIIFDNLSTDSTIRLIESYNNDKIKLTSEKDQGIYDAMNKGIKKASGDWLYFMGCDDYFASNSILEEIYCHLNKSHAMVYGNTILNPEGKVLHQKRNAYTIFLKNICHQAIFYNKNYLNNFKYNLKYPLLADWDLNIRIFRKYPFRQKYINNDIVCYSTLGASNNWGNSQDFKQHFMFKQKMFRYYLGNIMGTLFYLIFRASVFFNIKADIE